MRLQKDFKGLLGNIMNVDHCLIYTSITQWDLYCFDSRTNADMTKTCCSQNDLRCNASITSDHLYREFTWSVSQMLFDQNYLKLFFILQFFPLFLNPKTTCWFTGSGSQILYVVPDLTTHCIYLDINYISNLHIILF